MSDYQDQEEMHPSREELYDTASRRFFRAVGRFFKWIFISIAMVVAIGIGVFAYYAKDAPAISQEQMRQTGDSAFYDLKGNKLLALGAIKHVYVKDEDIPESMKVAVSAIEDRHFYQNPLGVDPIRIAKSFVDNIRAKDTVAGGSTITQQLVKLSVFSTAKSQQTIKRKAQEAWLAIKLSQQYSKGQIMELYLNKVYMNYGCYGVQTAANYYYGKSLKDLELPQIALLAGMLNAPTSYDPYVHPKLAQERRDLVLYALYSQGKIDRAVYSKSITTPINYGLIKNHDGDEEKQDKYWKYDDPYFKEAIAQLTKAGYNPYTQHMRIYLNIDQEAQKKLHDLVNDGEIQFTSDKMQVGAAVTDPTNGRILAIVGGRNLNSKIRLGYDRATQTSRSTGSTIKPILDYGPAIEKYGWSTDHLVDDSSYTYPGTNIVLNDWDYRHMGNITMRYALEQSRNIPAVRALQQVGMKYGSKFAKQMSVEVPLSQGLSAGIGAYASSVDMAGAYGAFANYGMYYKPSYVAYAVTEDGEKINFSPTGKRVMKASTAYILTDMLKGVLTRGSGTAARAGNLYEAGKTGTVQYSNEELEAYPEYKNTPKDSWFVGYTRRYVVSAWTGYDKISEGTIDEKVGTYAPQKLYKAMMTYLMDGKENKDWIKPTTVKKYGTVLSPVSAGESPDRAILVRAKASADASKKRSTTVNSSTLPMTAGAKRTTQKTYSDGSREVIEQTRNANGSITTKTTRYPATSTESGTTGNTNTGNTENAETTADTGN